MTLKNIFTVVCTALAFSVCAPAETLAQSLASRSNEIVRKQNGQTVKIPTIRLRRQEARSLQRSSSFKAAGGAEEFVCLGIVCFCVGDDDCNDMFTSACADSSTGGSCTEVDGETVCACTPNGS